MRRFAVPVGAGVLLAAAMLISSSCGTLSIPLDVTLRAIARGATGNPPSSLPETIVWSVRLPRVCVAALVGAGLGGSGAAMQGLFRNPLADPYLLGVASGASLGATLALMADGRLPAAFEEGALRLGASRSVPLGASVGAIAATLLTLLLAKTARGDRVSSLLLSGSVVGSVLVSTTTYLMMRDADRLRAVFSWTLGNLSMSGWSNLATITPYALAGLAMLLALSRGIDALQLGEDAVRTLGLRPGLLRFGVVIGASVTTAACVSLAGVIGFVGLVAPHIMRRLGAPLHRFLVPGAALLGASLLVVSDLLARTLARPAELPVGIVTTLLGGPFFLSLLRRNP